MWNRIRYNYVILDLAHNFIWIDQILLYFCSTMNRSIIHNPLGLMSQFECRVIKYWSIRYRALCIKSMR